MVAVSHIFGLWCDGWCDGLRLAVVRFSRHRLTCVCPGGGLHAQDPDALALDLSQFSILSEELGGSEEALLRSSPCSLPPEGPTQDTLDWGRGVVNVVAVEAEAGLESETVPRAEPTNVNVLVL